MKQYFTILIFFVAGCRSFSSSAQQSHAALEITPLTGNLYVYTTWGKSGGVSFPANGLYLVTGKGVVVIDSPWDTTQFQPLLDTIRKRHRQRVVLCIATHFHADRTAGLAFYKAKGIKTFTSRQTDSYSQANAAPRAEFLFDKDTVFTVGGYPIQTYYPGEGHTRDNIVVWFGRDRVLYGGCLIKSTEAEDLGYLNDGNLSAYVETITRLQHKYPNPAYVIPGHQSWESVQSLQHTLEMAKKAAPR